MERAQLRLEHLVKKQAFEQAISVRDFINNQKQQAAYRARAPQCHPDTGGSHQAFAELNNAREQALASI